MGIIYSIRNKGTNQRYIGLTTQTLDDRIKQHVYASGRDIHLPLYKDFSKDNLHWFDIEVLFETDEFDILAYKELEYINKYDTINNGYNISSNRYNRHLGIYNGSTISVRLGDDSTDILDNYIKLFKCSKSEAIRQLLYIANGRLEDEGIIWVGSWLRTSIQIEIDWALHP